MLLGCNRIGYAGLRAIFEAITASDRDALTRCPRLRNFDVNGQRGPLKEDAPPPPAPDEGGDESTGAKEDPIKTAADAAQARRDLTQRVQKALLDTR